MAPPLPPAPFFFDWYLVVFVFLKPVAQATEGTFWCRFLVNLAVMRLTLDCCWLFGGLGGTLGPAMGSEGEFSQILGGQGDPKGTLKW